jgi:hypothetical protein
MKKRKGNNHSLDQSVGASGMPSENKFGAIKDKKPAPRDGHSAVAT